jgi:NitT/TauT family transport system substrate-binding protein
MKHLAGNPGMRARGALTLVLAFALLLCAAGTAGADTTRVRVLVSQTTAALPWLAMAKDNAIPGVDLTVAFFSNHAQALAIMLRGDTDLLVSGTSQGWENRLDGSPIVMIDTGVWGISSLIGKNPAIKGFSDLKGKKIAMPFPGSPLDFQTRALLANEKIDPDKDVTISYGPFPQSVQLLLAGQLDAAALPEPLATTVVKKSGLVRLVEYSQAWARFTGGDRQSPQVSLFTTESYAKINAGIIASIVSAWDAASKKVMAHPADAAAQFAATLGVEQGILEEATRNTLLVVPAPAENKIRVQTYYQIVSKYFPAGPRSLDERFFFIP